MNKEEIIKMFRRIELDKTNDSCGFEFADGFGCTFDNIAICYDDRLKLYELTKQLQKENQELKKQYCERTDCSGRLGNSKKVEQLEKENQKLKENLKATNKGLKKIILKRKKWKHRYQLAKHEIKELKKQLEDTNEEVCILDMITDENIKYKNQQKEFIEYLEKMWKETQDIWYIKILQKYKEIIGDKQ